MKERRNQAFRSPLFLRYSVVKTVPLEFKITATAPAGTAAPRIARLNKALVEILGMSQMKDRMASLGFRPLVKSPQDFDKLMAAERIKWSAVIRNASLKLD